MIRACIFDLGGTTVDRYSFTPLLCTNRLFHEVADANIRAKLGQVILDKIC